MDHTTTWAAPDHVKTRLPDAVTDGRYEAAPLATTLGVFSLGLGLVETLAPRQVAAATGVGYPGVVRAFGAREAATGLGLLTARRPSAWLWGRVVGDALDLATIAAAYAAAGGHAHRRRLLWSAAAVAGVTALDLLCATAHSGE